MSTTRLMPLHIGKGRSFSTAISGIIDYVENPEKTDKGQLVTSYQCNARIADRSFSLPSSATSRKQAGYEERTM